MTVHRLRQGFEVHSSQRPELDDSSVLQGVSLAECKLLASFVPDLLVGEE